ncbi:MAG: hypothetical protein HYS98_06095 [Deltaproteobacteria bacterium]|nr:hypothetical protein [Deltaproteobacteria bacterium]
MIDRGYCDGITSWGFFQNLVKKIRYFDETFWFLAFVKRKSSFSALGCNMSLFKEDLYRVGGFDEDYIHRGGGEDTDLAMRLHYIGVYTKSVRYKAIEFHLGHDIHESKGAAHDLYVQKKRNLTSVLKAVYVNSSLRSAVYPESLNDT